MATMRAILQAHVDGLYPESIPLDLQWSNAASPGQLQTVTLTSGDNTLTVPAGTMLIVVKPPTTNATAIKVKGVVGDTGVLLQVNAPTVIGWASGAVILNAAANITGVQLLYL